MLKARFALIALALALGAVTARAAETGIFDPRSFGARGDGAAKDTVAIQAAIDAAARAGGGTVRLSAGAYLCGTVHLRSHLTFRVESGATLLESKDSQDFDRPEDTGDFHKTDRKTVDFHHALLAGENIDDIAIEGHGTLDGNRTQRQKLSFGPKPIALKNCRHVTVRDVTINNSPSYALSLLGCENVNIDGVTIFNSYEDGIDPDSCRYIRIANCCIDSRDDPVVLKSSCVFDPPKPTEYVTITNCVLSTDCNYFKMGTESSGAFRRIALTNCVMVPRLASMRTERNLAGIAIETVDGADVDGVVISNVTMEGVTCPIFMRLGARGRGQATPKPGVLRNISISNIMASGAHEAIAITGIPGHRIEGITLNNISVTTPSDGPARSDLDVPEKESGYPDPDMYGMLPCTGLYLRHAADVTIHGLQVNRTQADARALVVADDVSDIDIDGFRAEGAAISGPVFWMNDGVNAAIRNVRVAAQAETVLRTSGTCRNVTVESH